MASDDITFCAGTREREDLLAIEKELHTPLTVTLTTTEKTRAGVFGWNPREEHKQDTTQTANMPLFPSFSPQQMPSPKESNKVNSYSTPSHAVPVSSI
jgi:hypothetical protein